MNEQVQPAPTSSPHSVIKIWGAPSHPRWSVTVVQGTTVEDLDELVDLALDAFDLVRDRLEVRRAAERARR
jgi:hypothetical protein